jgi:hypothetical protein
MQCLRKMCPFHLRYVYRIFLPSLTAITACLFISHMFGPIDLLHPSSTPHLKTMQVFPIYLPKRPSFSSIPVLHFTSFFKFKSNLLIKRYFFQCYFTKTVPNLISRLAVHHLLSCYLDSWNIPHFLAQYSGTPN